MSLKTALTDSDAILYAPGWEHRPQLGSDTNGTVVLRRYWGDFDARSADTACTEGPATRTSPKADNQTYAGTWQVARRWSEGQDERSVKIIEELVTPDTTGLRISYRVNCDNVHHETHYWDLSRTQLDALDNAIADTYTKGVTRGLTWGDNDRGMLDAVLSVDSTQNREPVTNERTLTGPQLKRYEWHEKGITADSQIRSIDAPADGVIKRQEISARENCALDITTRIDSAIADSNTGVAGGSPQQTDSIYFYRNLDTLAVSAPTEGVDRVEANLNEFSRIDYTVRKIRPVLDSYAALSGGGPQERDSVSFVVNATGFSVAQGDTGSIVDVSGRLNEMGRINYSVRTATAVQDTAVGTTGGGVLVSDSWSGVRNADTVNVAAGSRGTLVGVQPSLNRYGKIDYEVRTQTANTDTAVGKTGGSVQATDSVVLNRNASSFAVDTGARGTIVSATPRLNEFGLIDYAVSTRTAQTDTMVGTAGGGVLVKDSVTSYANASSLSVSAGAAGTMVDVSPRLNEFGRIDYSVRTRTAQALSRAMLTGGNVLEHDSIKM